MQCHRVRMNRLAAQAAAWTFLKAAPIADLIVRNVGVIFVERAPLAQRLQQNLLILGADSRIQCLLLRCFGQQLGDMPLVVRLDLAVALRSTAKCAAAVDIGVVVDLEKGLQRNAEELDVMHHAVMVIGNSPGARIDVQVLVEFALLREAAELRVPVAAAQRPISAAGSGVVFEHLNLVAGVAQLIGCGQSGHAGAEDQHRGIARGALEINRPLVRRFGGKS